MTVTVTAQWKVSDPQTAKVLYQKTVVSSHTATIGDALMGVKRLRLANEGAAKANIAAGIKWLYELSLQPPLTKGNG